VRTIDGAHTNPVSLLHVPSSDGDDHELLEQERPLPLRMEPEPRERSEERAGWFREVGTSRVTPSGLGRGGRPSRNRSIGAVPPGAPSTARSEIASDGRYGGLNAITSKGPFMADRRSRRTNSTAERRSHVSSRGS